MTTTVPPLASGSSNETPDSARAFVPLRVTMSHPDPTSIVVHIAGEIDALTAPELRQLLGPRLASATETVVLDLSQVSFLGTAGLAVLVQATLRARHSRIDLRLVTSARCVERALAVTALRSRFACYPSVHAALI